MKTKLSVKTLIVIFSLILICSTEAVAQSNNNKKPDCAQITDQAIVAAIYDKIRVKYADQMRRINVRVKDKVVTIEGWVKSKGVVKDIEKMAKKVKCVKSPVVNNLKVGISGGCLPGQKKCGDICIPNEETCNIGGAAEKSSGSN
jgi:hypothetical protein